MPSPFPGMDPYLEGYLWPDVHNALANKIRQQLTPKLRPRYAVRLEVDLVEDTFPESEIDILYPDVEVMQLRQKQRKVIPVTDVQANTETQTSTILPPPLTLPLVQSVPVRLVNVEIRDTARNVLVTCIELLSPVNKREPGLTAYRRKRRRLYEAGVHLLEVDLLRRGTRPFSHPRLPEVSYAIALTRAYSKVMEVWPLTLQDSLPVIPIPLQPPDSEIPLDLSVAIKEVYDEAAYDLSLNYTELPPPPPLSEVDKQWMEMRKITK